ncbi:hypothetical protein DICPUDRAFT_74525 [Dictyostelium purpureum]|uniref:Brl1/Brr6 domain-containing protein n=1 Tax=Dictyostelium purpureum TaxID=5786 RepID=F0Z7Z8_DICPU|nr:uncharacterized protein DICPUDRAFT_74525 [Dictyostelium purpureum]EGC39902.1 hypothetical protein DICPUDRAFT_74525 [Dictyostelium purpureum]|eukprot:XP_003283531.1 hypothetical protein DICPUDRAFT_74525 [Dictyostelium purpureum]
MDFSNNNLFIYTLEVLLIVFFIVLLVKYNIIKKKLKLQNSNNKNKNNNNNNKINNNKKNNNHYLLIVLVEYLFLIVKFLIVFILFYSVYFTFNIVLNDVNIIYNHLSSEEKCNEWELCMDRDPPKSLKFKILADVLESSISSLSYKAMAFLFFIIWMMVWIPCKIFDNFRSYLNSNLHHQIEPQPKAIFVNIFMIITIDNIVLNKLCDSLNCVFE